MTGNSPGPIWIVSGTRPEVIKLAPVLAAIRARFGAEAVQWVSTGQHMALETETLRIFAISPDHRLPARAEGVAITGVATAMISALADLQRKVRPRLVVVQGDTVSTFAGAFAAFHAGIPVAHVEAGLRSHNIHDPFPEESYRRMTDAMSDLHFPPTRRGERALLAEGFDAGTVALTGNTALDAMAMIEGMEDGAGTVEDLPGDARVIFATMHRRESWGAPMRDLCGALRDLVSAHDDLHVLIPVHVNPAVRGTVLAELGGVPRIHLSEPLDFLSTHRMIRRADLIMTDSGGITEEAPSYGVPTLILRRFTERPEAVEAGAAELVGTDRDRVRSAAEAILSRPRRQHATGLHNPFGDGRAADRIALGIERFLAGSMPILTARERFDPDREGLTVPSG